MKRREFIAPGGDVAVRVRQPADELRLAAASVDRHQGLSSTGTGSLREVWTSADVLLA
jgi:hypothetical protein